MIRNNGVISVLGLTLVIILSGCNKGPDGAVLAKVNQATITTDDFKKQYEDLSPQLQQALATDPKMRKDYLEDLIGIELVIQEAKRQGLDKDEEFKKSMEARKKKIEEYKKQLDQQLQAATRDELFNNMLKKDLGDKLKNLPPPTDREALAFYNKNKDKIRTAAGKQISFKDIEPQIKLRLMQEKQRPLYIEYTKSLKAKATISIDDKALDTAVTGLSRSVDIPDGLPTSKSPATK
ncbi:MAG TPA: SurA N-terminal domain-containing protein [Nitrospirota bacterium]|nr:SurA N-terminal domain-containing protein [Nitrospirota bacterium]